MRTCLGRLAFATAGPEPEIETFRNAVDNRVTSVFEKKSDLAHLNFSIKITYVGGLRKSG
jgi:hypothetical protein